VEGSQTRSRIVGDGALKGEREGGLERRRREQERRGEKGSWVALEWTWRVLKGRPHKKEVNRREGFLKKRIWAVVCRQMPVYLSTDSSFLVKT